MGPVGDFLDSMYIYIYTNAAFIGQSFFPKRLVIFLNSQKNFPGPRSFKGSQKGC